MTKAARERLATLLGGEEAAAFSGQVSLPAEALSLEVEGVGPIRLPVKPPQAKKMCAVASPARFGHREETILDPAVRDTWEISPDLVRLDAPEAATMLLRPFRVEMLTPEHAKGILGLAGHYGPQWAASPLGVWFDERSRAYRDAELRRPDWVAALPGLCEAFGDEGGVTRELLTRSWRWLSRKAGMHMSPLHKHRKAPYTLCTLPAVR